MDDCKFLLATDEMQEWAIIFDVVFQRALVGKDNGISFVIHTAERGHNLPHLHANYQGKEAVIEIPSGRTIKGNLEPKKMKQASKWVREHEDFLKCKWNEFSQGICYFC